METPFFSRQSQYKSHFGAAPVGTVIRMRLFLPPDCFAPHLIARFDADDSRSRTLLMEREGDDRGGVWWSCDFTAETAGLYFYHFDFTSPYGYNILKRGRCDEAVLNPDGREWQQTVYDADFTAPGGFAGGTIYQIFPDRFCASGNPKKDLPSDRFYQTDRAAQPAYRQNTGPCSLGNDYYGGDLAGIAQKLPYLASLGVTCLYLNPIFEAHSNHRYNTADYTKIDPLLGDESDFSELCRRAHAAGIRIILDGVFSHTGDDSVYFNRPQRYGPGGAYHDRSSPYYPWYSFTRWPDRYHAWWGVPSLPETNETDPSFLTFITGENGILRRWMRLGADGWRLDVADELPDGFLDHVRAAVKAENPDALLLGEVWEDASLKTAYGNRRRYLLGRQVDSVMDYPLYNAVLAFLKGGDAWELAEEILTLLENYPAPAVAVLMNHMGTHDTPRLTTLLGGEAVASRGRDWQAGAVMSPAQREKGRRFARLAAVLQYTLPGIPSLYYGDETGAEGYGDPFNRGFFDWQKQNDPQVEFYRQLGQLRREQPAFQSGFTLLYAGTGHLAYFRGEKGQRVLIGVNRWCDEAAVPLPEGFTPQRCLFGAVRDGYMILPAEGACILCEENPSPI